MRELLQKFENKKPEIVFEWNDAETEARGWVVINSLRGGAAGGGTRMRPGLDKREVESLAKTMEVKFSVSGPPIGGAKSGIDFDPQDPRKRGVLERWFKVVTPLLKNYYGTGGDLNIDEIHEVIPITEDYGVWHPQEGVVTGHFHARENEKIQQIGQLRMGVSKVVEDPKFTPDPAKKYVIADMITGYGVAMSVMHYYDLRGDSYRGKRAIIQGWGNVGAAAAYYLAQAGVKVVGIVDTAGGIINTEGLTAKEVTQLFIEKVGNKLSAGNLMSFDEVNNKVWDTPAEIFLPCAASRLVTQNQVDRMVKAGLEVIACGANVPFADAEIFFGPIMADADKKISIIPDFVSNCGMARVFAYCMEKNVELSDEAIFADTSNTIKRALEEIYKRNKTNINLAETGFEIALEQLI
ncbi:amino acid dehydrogenase [Cryomorpha ignava]|uniref:Amino acid dehydrogenase n=1 Tax=Cryomorpha ignava TaxID=101383 RepID=A0A7K3WMV3_9FLAO|nr:Glu/Leu/Phe/Val dehydrogenase dimerization domain-containing protein [Cryomorpha ignava]NEN22814.1 amino acid dehydrogenase [Cryomorpha ignava]